MKLLITTVAGVALIALSGCNRAAPANNAAANEAANEAAPAPAANDAGAKPADGNAAAPADAAAPAGGDKPAGDTATETSSDDQPADQTDQGGK